MFAIKPLGLGSAEEELGSIGVGARIGHGENTWVDIWSNIWSRWPKLEKYAFQFITWSGVLQAEVFILKLASIDRLSTSSIASGEVASLPITKS